jgi:hypothetical protein
MTFERRPLRRLSMGRGMIRSVSKKWGLRMYTELIWLRIGRLR